MAPSAQACPPANRSPIAPHAVLPHRSQGVRRWACSGAAALPEALRKASHGGEVTVEVFAIFNSFGRADLELTTFRQAAADV